MLTLDGSGKDPTVGVMSMEMIIRRIEWEAFNAGHLKIEIRSPDRLAMFVYNSWAHAGLIKRVRRHGRPALKWNAPLLDIILVPVEGSPMIEAYADGELFAMVDYMGRESAPEGP